MNTQENNSNRSEPSDTLDALEQLERANGLPERPIIVPAFTAGELIAAIKQTAGARYL